jgi:hypothetical protein
MNFVLLKGFYFVDTLTAPFIFNKEMESFRDPFNALTVINSLGGLGFAAWVVLKLKEDTENQKELCAKVDDLVKIVKGLEDFAGKGKHNFAVLDGHQQKLTKELKVLQRKIDALNLETIWTIEALRKLEKFEKTKDRDFKLPRKIKNNKSRSKYESESESDSQSESESDDDRTRRPSKEDKEDEPQMRKPRKK